MKRDITIFVIFLVLVGGLFSLPERRSDSLAGSIRDVFAVPQFGLQRVRGWFRAGGSGRNALLQENQNLRIQVEELRNELRQYKPLQEENRQLREILRVKSASRYSLLAAQLLTRDVNGWWQMVRIDKGAEDGVEVNLPVISPEGLVGRTAKVSRLTADVLFLTDPAIKISARLARSDVHGIVRGANASGCRLDFINNSAEISRADEVVTSGLGGVYPPGLVIGYIEKVQADASGLFQSAEVVPAADLRSLDMVFVVLPEKGAGKPDDRKKEQP